MFFEDEYEIISSSDCKPTEATIVQNASTTNDVSGEVNSCINFFVNAIKSVIQNKSFDGECLKRKKIFLSEAYCLLWQQSGTADFERMKSSIDLKTGAYAAILLDLYASKKISIQKSTSNLHHRRLKSASGLIVRIIDAEPTFTFMDRLVFDTIIQYDNRSAGSGVALETLLSLAQKCCCVTACLKNLVSRGILGNHRTQYTVINVGPILELERDLKAVGVKERRPDSYMLALLTLSLLAENCYSFVDPILKKHFTKKEFKVAKENIKMIVETQGVVLKSPRFTRKKFSTELPPLQTNAKTKHDNYLQPIPASPR